MKTTYRIKTVIVVTLLIIGFLFGLVPYGSAQSVQDWSEPINLSMSGAASNPSMVVDGNGVVHVIWVDQFDGFKYVQSTDNGATWTLPVNAKYPFSTEAAPPMLLSGSAGIIHILWLTDQNKLSYAQTLADNFDTPASWRVKTDLDSSVFDFDASLDAQGRIHVAYVKNPAPVPGTAGVYYKRSADAGNNWAVPKLLYESPYFRSLNAENARIRLAASDDPEDEQVYVVWDDRPQKRIFISTSVDGGLNWDAVKELVAPQSDLGFSAPYNADIDVLGNEVLATWLVGEPGARCTPYSWSSSDGGETWGEQEPILSESAQCPERAEFTSLDPAYSVVLFTIQGDLSISAWNGDAWSTPEIQVGPSSITNPTTFDPVALGCEQAVPFDGRLFVVGCDQTEGGAASGDIWFVVRQLDPLDNLFPLPSEWSGDANVVSAPRTLSALASVTDAAGTIHAVWVQSASLPSDPFTPRIEYARGDGSTWTRPSPIITNVDGVPRNLSLQIDSQQRLLLSWMKQQTGELVFTWSSAERANIPLEWIQPVVITASSKLIDSPDMLVDATDRIVVAYAITLNEERGIYVIQSTDLGETWSMPVRIFDAVAENWEMVDQPKLAITEDGTLHILFSQYSLAGEPQPVGLYYSASKDGGVTWAPAEVVSEQVVSWSEIVAYGGTLHRLWQEKNRLAVTTNHQVSLDRGVTWAPGTKLPGGAGISNHPAVSLDWSGDLHFLQVIRQDGHMLQEWGWVNERWQLLESRKVARQESISPTMIESGISSNGRIFALLVSEELLEGGIQTHILSLNRTLEMTGVSQPVLASIPSPSSSLSPTPDPDLAPTSTPGLPLADMEDQQSGVNRNIVGLALIASVVVFILVLTVPRRSKGNNPTKTSK